MQLDIDKIRRRLTDDPCVRLRIAKDFGVEASENERDEFISGVLRQLDQQPISDPLGSRLSNTQVFRAAVRALGSNSRDWAAYLRNEAAISEILCGYNPAAAARDAREEQLRPLLAGQTAAADARAMLAWARSLADDVLYSDRIAALGAAFRAISLKEHDVALSDAELMICIVGYVGNPPANWRGTRLMLPNFGPAWSGAWKTPGMSYVLASEFFRNMGWNGFKPDRHIQRLISRWLPDWASVARPRADRLLALIGRRSAPLAVYLGYSVVGISLSPTNVPLSHCDNLVWLLGKYVETKRRSSVETYLTA